MYVLQMRTISVATTPRLSLRCLALLALQKL